MEIDRILVAIDFSPQAESALDQAARIARQRDAQLTVLHAIPADVPEPPADLERHRARLEAAGVVAAARTITGDPAAAIVDAAAELRADLVVVGTHGRTGFSRLLLGSVAERVVRDARTSVMVARGDRNALERLLVPTDFSPQAEVALQLALLVARDGSSIELFHCWLPPAALPLTGGVLPAPGPIVPGRPENLAERADESGAALVERYRNGRVEISFARVEEPAVRGIHERLQRGDVDCVVLGSHGHRGLRRWLLGSVAEPTVRYAPCSAVVVRAS